MLCRKRTGRQTRLLTLPKRKVGVLGMKEGDCPGARSRSLQIAHCSVAWRISWARFLCPPGERRSSTHPWVLFLQAPSFPQPGTHACLLAYGGCCMSLRLCRAPIPDRRCHLNPDQREICWVPVQPHSSSWLRPQRLLGLCTSNTSRDMGTALQEPGPGQPCVLHCGAQMH